MNALPNGTFFITPIKDMYLQYIHMFQFQFIVNYDDRRKSFLINKKDKHEIKNSEIKVIGRSKSEDDVAEDCPHQ